jgi:hypothetical protein
LQSTLEIEEAQTTFISEHGGLLTGISAGKDAIATQDFDFAYALHADGVRVATFAEGRIGYREEALSNGRLSDIHIIDDRYDHYVDELLI